MSAPGLLIGERIRYWREKKQRKQAAVAGLCGITEEYLSQIERGLKIPSLPVLQALAAELGVPMAALLSDDKLDEPPAENASVADSVVSALMGYGPASTAPPETPSTLRERVESVWRIWQKSPNRFTEAGAVLPELIVDTENAVRAHRFTPDSAARRDVLRTAADLYFMLRSHCRRAGRIDLSLMVADRALRAADDADDPIRSAAARWNLGHVLLADGEYEGAKQIAIRGVEALNALPKSPDLLAMAGALDLVAVVADARHKNWWEARERLAESALPRAEQVGEGNTMWTVFGPTNVELHAMSIEMEAGEAAEALRVADQIDTAHLPSIERRFTFLLEVARCYDLRREDPAVLVHLLDLEATTDDAVVKLLWLAIINIEDKRARERAANNADQGARSGYPGRLVEGARTYGWTEALNELTEAYPGRIRQSNQDQQQDQFYTLRVQARLTCTEGVFGRRRAAVLGSQLVRG